MSDQTPGTEQPARGSVSTTFRQRLAARTRVRRWSRTKAIAAGLGVVAVVALLAWVVLGSSLLAVRTIEVHGADSALAASVRARAASAVGTPLARVSTSHVASDVEQVRSIGAVRVRRDWPHTLRIDVVLRRPVAFAPLPDGGYELLDSGGVVIKTVGTAPSSLPRVVVGTGVGANLADGATVLAAAPPAVRAKVERVNVVSGQDIRLTLRNGVQVRWGSVDNSAYKASVLAALVKHKARVYDVSAPDLPTTRQ